jgi:hypothetical protein
MGILNRRGSARAYGYNAKVLYHVLILRHLSFTYIVILFSSQRPRRLGKKITFYSTDEPIINVGSERYLIESLPCIRREFTPCSCPENSHEGARLLRTKQEKEEKNIAPFQASLKKFFFEMIYMILPNSSLASIIIL